MGTIFQKKGKNSRVSTGRNPAFGMPPTCVSFMLLKDAEIPETRLIGQFTNQSWRAAVIVSGSRVAGYALKIVLLRSEAENICTYV